MTSFIVSAFAIAIAVSVHEFGHSYISYKLGDSTAKNSGRMTLNPLVHIDPIGLLMMFLVGVGFATPVPVNSSNFKRETRKRDLVLVSLGGAGFNVLTAILCAILMKFIPTMSAQIVLMSIIGYNLSFSAFNLLPLPLLDGWNILKQFIPYKYHESVYRYENMSMFIFLIMIITDAHLVMMRPISMVLNSIVQIFM